MTLPANSVSAKRLLLVSPESYLGRSLQSVVGEQLWHIEQAFTGLEALERVESASPADLVMVDLRPGDTEALHTLRLLRKVNPRVPIVLISHGIQAREVQEGLQ